jgi:hypothetical protein
VLGLRSEHGLLVLVKESDLQGIRARLLDELFVEAGGGRNDLILFTPYPPSILRCLS